VTIGGNAETHPQITIAVGAGGMQDMRLQRLVNGYPVEEVSYKGSLVNGDRVYIDCQARRVLLNSGDAYNSNFDYTSPEWITLEPGVNTLRLLMAQLTNSANVYVRYYEAYR
jgi:phage-related protein